MSKSRIIVRLVGVIVISIGLMYLWAVYSIRRSIDQAFGPEALSDVEDLSVALKGVAGKSLLATGNAIPSDSDLGAHNNNLIDMGKELMAHYRKDPETYKRNAKVFETYANAFDVGRAALSNSSPLHLPINSTNLTSLAVDKRLDAWSRPFCLIGVNNRIAVISAGAGADAPISCDETGVTKREIRGSVRKFYERPTGQLVLIIDDDTSTRSVAAHLPTQ
ncbi:MAG: hypothetical protein WAU89_17000 [Candidatus Acidiferrales bacterium]